MEGTKELGDLNAERTKELRGPKCGREHTAKGKKMKCLVECGVGISCGHAAY